MQRLLTQCHYSGEHHRAVSSMLPLKYAPSSNTNEGVLTWPVKLPSRHTVMLPAFTSAVTLPPGSITSWQPSISKVPSRTPRTVTPSLLETIPLISTAAPITVDSGALVAAMGSVAFPSGTGGVASVSRLGVSRLGAWRWILKIDRFQQLRQSKRSYPCFRRSKSNEVSLCGCQRSFEPQVGQRNVIGL